MIPSFSNHQLQAIMTLARELDPEKRGVYLERIAAILQQRAGRHDTDDVIAAAEAALRGLLAQHTAA